jgi:hypothetical protein|tara:strand:- start:298 stop:945 length:648 start_codon:yes stop_codon:yes gene_type:complete
MGTCGDTVAGVLPRRDGAATSELLAPVCDRLRFISHDPHSSPPLVYSTVMCFGMSSLAGRSLNVLLDLWFFLAPQKRHCSKRRMYFSGGTGSGLSLVVAMPACSDASAVDDTTGADDLDADDTTGADVLDAFDAFGFSRDPLPEPEKGLNAHVSDVNLRRAERWRDASGVREQNKITLCQSLEGSLTPLRCHYTGRAFDPQTVQDRPSPVPSQPK